MMYKEFIELIGGEKISCEDYQKVETVYMYHPLIGEVEPKKQILKFWKLGGMALINDMLNTAEAIKDKQSKINSLEHEIDMATRESQEKVELVWINLNQKIAVYNESIKQLKKELSNLTGIK